MTGPEHYREAENLLNAFDNPPPEYVAQAQVHATLAQVEIGRASEKWLGEIANSLEMLEMSVDAPFSDVASAIRQAGASW